MQSTPAQDYTRKLAKAFAEAQAAGLKPWDYDTWADRLLRRLGFRLPPLLYVPLPWLELCLLVAYGMTWLVMGHFFIWLNVMPNGAQVIASGLPGVLVGVLMAV